MAVPVYKLRHKHNQFPSITAAVPPQLSFLATIYFSGDLSAVARTVDQDQGAHNHKSLFSDYSDWVRVGIRYLEQTEPEGGVTLVVGPTWMVEELKAQEIHYAHNFVYIVNWKQDDAADDSSYPMTALGYPGTRYLVMSFSVLHRVVSFPTMPCRFVVFGAHFLDIGAYRDYSTAVKRCWAEVPTLTIANRPPTIYDLVAAVSYKDRTIRLPGGTLRAHDSLQETAIGILCERFVRQASEPGHGTDYLNFNERIALEIIARTHVRRLGGREAACSPVPVPIGIPQPTCASIAETGAIGHHLRGILNYEAHTKALSRFLHIVHDEYFDPFQFVPDGIRGVLQSLRASNASTPDNDTGIIVLFHETARLLAHDVAVAIYRAVWPEHDTDVVVLQPFDIIPPPHQDNPNFILTISKESTSQERRMGAQYLMRPYFSGRRVAAISYASLAEVGVLSRVQHQHNILVEIGVPLSEEQQVAVQTMRRMHTVAHYYVQWQNNHCQYLRDFWELRVRSTPPPLFDTFGVAILALVGYKHSGECVVLIFASKLLFKAANTLPSERVEQILQDSVLHAKLRPTDFPLINWSVLQCDQSDIVRAGELAANLAPTATGMRNARARVRALLL